MFVIYFFDSKKKEKKKELYTISLFKPKKKIVCKKWGWLKLYLQFSKSLLEMFKLMCFGSHSEK